MVRLTREQLKSYFTKPHSEIVGNYKEDTLYVSTFDKGKYITLARIDVSPQVKLEIQVSYINDKQDINQFRLIKHKLNKGKWQETEEKIKLSKFNMAKVQEFFTVLQELNLDELTQSKISLKQFNSVDDITKQSLKRLLTTEAGIELIKELTNNAENIVAKDIVSISYRKEQLEVFSKLLFEENYIQQYKSDNGFADKKYGEENIWQHFFEKNPWIFGYGLNYICCTNLDETTKLEQTVAGFTFNSSGKRTDALMRTRAFISQFVLLEIKTPSNLLVKNQPRNDCWSISQDITDAIAQIHKTVYKFKEVCYNKAELRDKEGNITGLNVYNVTPKSYLIIGTLEQLKDNPEKYSSFEVFRKSVNHPEIITYDELYERAKFIVENLENNEQNIDNDLINYQEEDENWEPPF